ncbi:MAG: hypothetical protein H8D88_01295 [Bacteroidetes bacterium]|nr:hypothetical protein [Bacteroidota bacterium]
MSADTLKVVNDLREKYGIDVEHLVRLGLLPPNAAKKWLVKAMYFDLARDGNTIDKGGRTYTDIKMELSIEYGISISSIEKLIYR